MSVRKPTLIRSTFSYVFVGFLPVAANFLLAPVYTRFLSPEQYALVGLAALFQTFLTFFLSLSLDSAFSKIYFDYEKKKKLKYAVFGSLIITVILISALSLVLLFFFGDMLFSAVFSNKAFKFSDFGYWVVITTFSNIIFLFFAILYRNEENIKKFIRLNLLFFFVPVLFTLTGLILYRNGALGAVMGRAIGSVLFIAVLLAGYFIKHKPVYKFRYFKIALKFSLPLIPYQLMFAGFSNIDRLMIEKNFQPHDFGVYNLAVMVTGVIPVFLNALSNATNPRIFRELSNNGDVHIITRFNYLSLFFSTGAICLCIAGVVPAMRLIINKDYSDSYLYIGTLFLSFLPYLHFLVYNLPLFFFGKTSAFPVISFFALVAGIAFNKLFIPVFGIWSVCLSLYVIRLVQALAAYIYLRRYKFNKLVYVRHTNAIIGSLAIVLIYNIFLQLHLHMNFLSIDLINIIPLIIFIVVSIIVYSRESDFIISMGKRILNINNSNNN